MTPETLSSLQNPRVRAFRSLKDRKGRKELNAFLVEGDKMVEEALKSSFPPRALLLRQDRALPDGLPEDLPVYFLPEHVFASVCDTKTPQGIAAVMGFRESPAPRGHLLALDGVQDPGNVGTIIRTADAAGFDGVLLSADCADVFSPKVLRATMGSVFHLPLLFPDSLPDALNTLKAEGYEIWSSQLDGDPFFDHPAEVSSLVLVIGNEGNGVSPPVQATATRHLRLPMRGNAESLNAAIAAGIMMYDIERNR